MFYKIELRSIYLLCMILYCNKNILSFIWCLRNFFFITNNYNYNRYMYNHSIYYLCIKHFMGKTF